MVFDNYQRYVSSAFNCSSLGIQRTDRKKCSLIYCIYFVWWMESGKGSTFFEARTFLFNFEFNMTASFRSITPSLCSYSTYNWRYLETFCHFLKYRWVKSIFFNGTGHLRLLSISQSSVSLGVSQHTHIICKHFGSIGHRSCKRIIWKQKHKLLAHFMCFQKHNKRLQAWSFLSFEWEIISFSKTLLLQRESFLTMPTALCRSLPSKFSYAIIYI